jgi:hypothetical protein
VDSGNFQVGWREKRFPRVITVADGKILEVPVAELFEEVLEGGLQGPW